MKPSKIAFTVAALAVIYALYEASQISQLNAEAEDLEARIESYNGLTHMGTIGVREIFDGFTGDLADGFSAIGQAIQEADDINAEEARLDLAYENTVGGRNGACWLAFMAFVIGIVLKLKRV